MTVQMLLDALNTLPDKEALIVRYSLDRGCWVRCNVVVIFDGDQRRDLSGNFDKTPDGRESYKLVQIS
jgi:hypothetical protein